MSDPGSLVEGGVRHYGRFAVRPRRVNPNDEFGVLSRTLHGWRLKEWIGFTLLHPDLYSSLIMQDAQYLASSEIYARVGGRLHQHSATARGGSPALPEVLEGGHCSFQRRGYEITYDFSADDGTHVMRVNVDETAAAPSMRGELRLDAAGASAPLSVSSRLPSGRMYTHKAIFPVDGELRIGDTVVVFDGARDLAILDEHRSALPYRTTWLWGTFALQTGDGIAGANFAARPAVPGEEEESCLWAPGTCERLADITFEPRSDDPLASWRIASADGRLDVVFEPEGRMRARHQFGIFAIDYFQLHGTYAGTVRAGGCDHRIEGVHGVCESMRARL